MALQWHNTSERPEDGSWILCATHVGPKGTKPGWVLFFAEFVDGVEGALITAHGVYNLQDFDKWCYGRDIIKTIK